MVNDWIEDPYYSVDPVAKNSETYGHNQEHALTMGITFTLVELAVFYAIIRPWTFVKSYKRVGMSVMVFLLWALISLFMSMHAGRIFMFHFFWVIALVLTSFFYVFKRR